jgi:methylmalonyl-CoA mutase
MPSSKLDMTMEFPPADLAAWRTLAEKDLAGATLQELIAHTLEGLGVEPLYTREVAVAADARGFPGLPPFVRGGDAVERSGKGWQVCQEHDHPGLEAASTAMAADLARGATALWVRLGLADGVRVLTAADIDRLFEGVDLGHVPVHLEPGPDVVPVAAAFVSVAEGRGTPLEQLRGGFGCDPLGTLARHGTLASGLGGAFAELVDLVGWARAKAPGVRPVLVSSVPYHDAGAHAVQELAYVVATGVEYLRRLEAAGTAVDDAAPTMLFQAAVGGDFFMEVAKLRALRWLWSKAVAAAGGAEGARHMRLHARTSRRTKACRDPWVNMLRATAECFAAAVGGADSVACAPFDEAIGPSDAFARRVARNTQLVLREEAHLHRVMDPAGGSWYLESLTEQLARAAWEELRTIERAGGMARLLATGRVLPQVEASRQAREKDVAHRKAPLVGVSEYPNLHEAPVERAGGLGAGEAPLGRGLRNGDDDARRGALEALVASVGDPVERAPGALASAVIKAAATGLDLFTLSALLRLGKPSRHIEPLAPWRAAEAWEALRDASDAQAQEHGARPKVFLANLGPIPAHRARADYAHNLFAAAGIEPVTNDGFDGPQAAAKAFAESGAELAVICGSDATYPEAVPDLAARLKDAGASAVLLAGRPGEHEAAYREAGVDRFVHVGADVLHIMREMLREVGVRA